MEDLRVNHLFKVRLMLFFFFFQIRAEYKRIICCHGSRRDYLRTLRNKAVKNSAENKNSQSTTVRICEFVRHCTGRFPFDQKFWKSRVRNRMKCKYFSCESTRLPPTWPGFNLQTWRHTWVEFVGSLLCFERFSPGTPVFPSLRFDI